MGFLRGVGEEREQEGCRRRGGPEFLIRVLLPGGRLIDSAVLAVVAVLHSRRGVWEGGRLPLSANRLTRKVRPPDVNGRQDPNAGTIHDAAVNAVGQLHVFPASKSP